MHTRGHDLSGPNVYANGVLIVFFLCLPHRSHSQDGYYNGTKQQVTKAWEDGLLRRRPEEWIHFVDTPMEALAYVESEVGRPVTVLDFHGAARHPVSKI